MPSRNLIGLVTIIHISDVHHRERHGLRVSITNVSDNMSDDQLKRETYTQGDEKRSNIMFWNRRDFFNVEYGV